MDPIPAAFFVSSPTLDRAVHLRTRFGEHDNSLQVRTGQPVASEV